MNAAAAIDRVLAATRDAGRLSVAVSGGVDSMVLANVLHGAGRLAALHAVSPAVPARASARVREHAERFDWALTVLDAGELDDPRYRANPLERCYFCKLNLYGAIAARSDAALASGTNTDDLADFRPGLTAAELWKVRHPWVEAGVDKATVYAIARHLGLDDLAALPAQPCLASRVETGIAIDAEQLALIESLETRLADALTDAGLSARTLRARLTRSGIVLQVDRGLVATVRALADDLDLAERCGRHGHALVGVQPYERGSAFLQPDAASAPGPAPGRRAP